MGWILANNLQKENFVYRQKQPELPAVEVQPEWMMTSRGGLYATGVTAKQSRTKVSKL